MATQHRAFSGINDQLGLMAPLAIPLAINACQTAINPQKMPCAQIVTT